MFFLPRVALPPLRVIALFSLFGGIGYATAVYAAFRIAQAEMGTESERIRMLQQRLLAGIAGIEQVFINGHLEKRVPHNLNMSFNFVEGESLIMGIKGIAVSSGSACTSASLEPSYVLRALGRSDELAHSSLRMTIGRFTTEEEIDYVVSTLKDRVAKLRELSPLWEMYQDGVDLILDVPTSSVGLAVNQIAKEKNKAYINTGAAIAQIFTLATEAIGAAWR